MRRATIMNKKENLYWRVIISYIHSLWKKQEARDTKIQQITETIARRRTPISPHKTARIITQFGSLCDVHNMSVQRMFHYKGDILN